MKINLL